VILGLVAVGGLFFGWKANAALDSTQQAVAAQLKTTQQAVDQQVTALKDRLALAEKTNTGLQSDLSVVTKRLRITQGQLKAAREEAAKLHEETTQQISALDTSVKGELATKASSDELKTVDTKVGGVRTDLDATREDLRMARSEMGTLIARNHEEIEQLRRLGERDYVEFTIAGKGKPQTVGNVTLELRGTNLKKNQFSMALTVEDKRFEKKNRAVNEPIFFYLAGTRQPQEIVVNKVSKNQISGYLSIPKANAQPKASASSGSGR
jgi:chromosome segregation ATPase